MKAWVEEHLKKLNLVEHMNQPEGFTRLGYSEEETKSIEVFKNMARKLSLNIREDVAGNVIATWEGSEPNLPVVAVGSHLDTVTNGGGYDGLAGVLCGVGAVKQLMDQGFQPKHSIEVIVFRSEESARFGISTIGSKAIAGILDPSIGDLKDAEGVSIKEAVQSSGFNWDEITKAERMQEEIKSFIELHIEQGTIIEDHAKDYGVVRGIATPIRLKVTSNGQAGHTGTTPMKKRKDAFVAIAPLINFVYDYTTKLNEEQNIPVVATVSTVQLQPNAMNVIPGLVELGIDIRSVDDALKESVAKAIREKCHELESTYSVHIEVEQLVNNKSNILDESIREKLVEIGKDLGLKAHVMDSGAGHDVMNMAVKWPTGLIFIPCKDGLSHHPKEYATIDDLVKGIELLQKYLKQEAGE